MDGATIFCDCMLVRTKERCRNLCTIGSTSWALVALKTWFSKTRPTRGAVDAGPLTRAQRLLSCTFPHSNNGLIDSYLFVSAYPTVPCETPSIDLHSPQRLHAGG